MAMTKHAARSAGVGAAPLGDSLKVPKTAELIADWVRDYVRRNNLRHGDALPSEPELRARFQASRPTVREAMRILEAKHLVRIARGASGGARYNVPGAAMVAEHTGVYLEAHGASQADFSVARLTIEPSIMGFIADTAAMKDIQRLAQSAAQQATLVEDVHAFAREHERFYQILADICANTTLSMFVQILGELMRAQSEQIGNVLIYEGEEAARGRRGHIRAKERLIELLRERDREGAEKWWRRHLRAQLDELVAGGRGGIVIKAPRRGA
ncbi:MAG: FadR family transcriptional regulator [Hydrogenophilaceae bacterium]|jgi:DNA-binding FadR family transcriptional regulator|nr:FadR family transcriptional regulator [Hydrogenophilaceae bacterium]